MKKLSLLMVIASLGLGSCSSSTAPVTSTASPAPVASSSPVVVVPPSPVASIAPSVPQVAIPGLVPSIDPELRRKEIAKGKQDPFLSFPIQAARQVKARKDVAINLKPKKSSLPPTSTPIKTPPTPIVETTPALPPTPDLANATVVSGVITIGNSIKILLKAPNEDNTRYVQVGQYISNGQILVKRVENPNSPTPVVVLEQNKQEVYKKIGQAIIAEPKTSPKPGAGILSGE